MENEFFSGKRDRAGMYYERESFGHGDGMGSGYGNITSLSGTGHGNIYDSNCLKDFTGGL